MKTEQLISEIEKIPISWDESRENRNKINKTRSTVSSALYTIFLNSIKNNFKKSHYQLVICYSVNISMQ